MKKNILKKNPFYKEETGKIGNKDQGYKKKIKIPFDHECHL